MATCTFFGHRDCPVTILPKLRAALQTLILEYRVNLFYVGNQGQFDVLVQKALSELSQIYPHIRFSVVLAYLPQQRNHPAPCKYDTVYPEGIELVPKRFAIVWRNNWMLQQSDHVVAYLTHEFGGAAQFVSKAQKQNKLFMNLADK